VTLNQRSQRALKGRYIERPAQLQRPRNVVGRTPRLKLLQEPQPLLCKRELGWTPQEGQDLALALPQLITQLRSQRTHRCIQLKPIAFGPNLNSTRGKIC
jgi:hypothetical protein